MRVCTRLADVLSMVVIRCFEMGRRQRPPSIGGNRHDRSPLARACHLHVPHVTSQDKTASAYALLLLLLSSIAYLLVLSLFVRLSPLLLSTLRIIPSSLTSPSHALAAFTKPLSHFACSFHHPTIPSCLRCSVTTSFRVANRIPSRFRPPPN